MFEIDNDVKAEWALSKIKDEAAERDRMLELVAAERERLNQMETDILNDYENGTSYLLSQLERYMQTVNAKETKTQKTYKLLSGSLVMKKARTEMQNTDALKEWAKQNKPEFVETTEKLRWGDFKKTLQIVDGIVVTDGGEIVEGVQLVEKEAEFGIKF